jgi:flagellar operon protein
VSDLISNAALLPPGGAVGPATPAAKPGTASTAGAAPAAPGPSFADVLAGQTAVGTPTFSKHAIERLTRRGVELDSTTLGRLTDGIQRAAGKGARNSVVFVDGTAYVASVQNNTVITAVTPEAMRSHVFTNIDSAVIA